MRRQALLAAMVLPFCGATVVAQFDSGSDGSDGPLECPVDCDAGNPCTIEIDLALATTATWDTPSPEPGLGVYDPEKWAVVFKYTTIDIPEGCTITFTNHPSGAPVVWLATDRVIIAGTVDLSGEYPHASGEIPFYAEAGPGGFGGNIAQSVGAGGFGPGGAGQFIAGGSYATYGCNASSATLYGNSQILPLIGGSGGSSDNHVNLTGSGAGGGAILIASGTAQTPLNSTITMASTGLIRCNGSYRCCPKNRGGSGGAIRLIAETVEGPGRLEALGGSCGGNGRIRIEATNNLATNSEPVYSFGTPPGPVFPPADAPTLRVTHIDGVPVPDDPDAGIVTQDVEIQNDQPVEITIEATNIPKGTIVDVRVVPVRGAHILVASTVLLNAGGGILTATAVVNFPAGRSEIQLRATW